MRGILGRRGLSVLAVAGAALVMASPAWAATVVNGDFETGTLAGFTVVNQPGGNGSYFAYSSANQPPTGCAENDPPAAPPQGTFAATSSQDGVGSHVLYQDITLEPNATHELSFTLYYKNSTGVFHTPSTLDYTPGSQNQQYRVDILEPSADPFSVAPADVLAPIFRTDPGEPSTLDPTPLTFNLSPYAGQTVRLRFAEVDNQGCFSGSVDDIDVRTQAEPEPEPEPEPAPKPQAECTKRGTSGTTSSAAPPAGTSSAAVPATTSSTASAATTSCAAAAVMTCSAAAAVTTSSVAGWATTSSSAATERTV